MSFRLMCRITNNHRNLIMKKSFILIAFPLILLSFFATTSFAQKPTRTNQFAIKAKPKQLRVKNVNSQRHIMSVSSIKLEDGRQRIARNVKTGSNLLIRVKGGKIIGFEVRKKNGRVIGLTKRSSKDVPPGFGCPDGFDYRLICYTHPTYDVMVCYSLCVANTLTFRIPSEW